MVDDPFKKERAAFHADKKSDVMATDALAKMLQQHGFSKFDEPKASDFFTPEKVEQIETSILGKIVLPKPDKVDYDTIYDFVEEYTTDLFKKVPTPKDGHTPSEKELIKLITPLIPEAKDGKAPKKSELESIVKSVIDNLPKKKYVLDRKQIELIIDEKHKALPIQQPRQFIGSVASLSQLTDVDLSGLSQDTQGNYILGAGGASDFLSLDDTPSSFSGEALKILQVNAGETALEFVTLAGGGDALTANPLSQFAATTSLQLKGVISDETGSGALVFGTAPAISSPTGIVTDDITESTDKNYITDAQQTALHAAVTVSDSSEIDFTLTAQDITASIVTGSIDVLKLDAGVQTSLGLADSSTQPADIADFITDASTETLTNKSYDADGTGNVLTNVGFPEFDTDVADTMGFVAGAYLDNPSVAVTSDGATITVTVEQDGGGDLRTHFITGLQVIDCTPALTATLTAGSDTVPTMNYIYFDEPTTTLTVNTTGFPVADIARVAEVLCPSASKVQSEGPYAQRNWTDHLASTTCGHLSHLNVWVRSQAATWISGVTTTPTITINGGAEDNIDVATSSGSVLQLHSHTYPAFNTAVSSHAMVVNDFTTPYVEITDLNAADTDDAGNAIGNNKYTNLVLWGVVSEDSADCHLMVNLPAGFHSSAAAATIDAEGYSNYTIPADYKGTGFLIARLTFKYSTSSSGTWTLTENKDLRNGGSTGGSGTGTTEFSDNVFRILDDADTSKEIAFQASGITTATTRTITMADADVDLADIATNNAKLTADTTNVTAAGALMDSEVTNLAQVKAFDTTDYATAAQGTTADAAMQDLVDDTTPTLGGELDAGANSIGFTMQTATGDGTTTVDWKLGNHMDFTFGAFNETFTFTAPTKPGVYTLSLKQDSVGSRTATWPATVKWPSGTAPTLTTTATTGYDIVTFRFDGTNYYGGSLADFS